MKCKYLFLLLIIASCSEPIPIQSINVQYEVNDNVSFKRIIINCEYTKKGEGRWYKTFCDNEPEGENRRVASAKVFDNSSSIISQKIKAETGEVDHLFIYKFRGNNYSETVLNNQLAEIVKVEKKFNIKFYPPTYGDDGILIGRTDDIYNFYVSEYIKHSKPQAEKKLCGKFHDNIASEISISTRVLPELADVQIYFSDLNKNCTDWSPYLEFEPKFLNPSDGRSLSEIADGKEIKVTIDINPQNHNLENLAKEILKNSPGYCVYKDPYHNTFHISNARRSISNCRSTCFGTVFDANGNYLERDIPIKFQYSVSKYEMNRLRIPLKTLPEDRKIKPRGYYRNGYTSVFSCSWIW